jgi:hypothetical protein
VASFIRRAGAEVLRTIARTLDPAAEAARIQLYSKAVGTVPQMFAREIDSPHQISGIESSLWDRPLVPHALDDEFESTVLSPSWTVSGAVPAQGGIDPFASAIDRYELHTDRRPSWLMIQTGGTQFSKDITSLPANFFVYARASFSQRVASVPNNEATVQLDIGPNPYDLNNRVSMYMNESDASTIQAEYLTVNAGAVTSINVSRDMFVTRSQLQSIEAVGIQKIGNTYHGWVFGGNGASIYMGSAGFAGLAVQFATIRFVSGGVTAPGYVIMGIDFMRFKEGALFLP